jgi:hypothetical protein
MRDILEDLKDRAKLLDGQINDAQAHFEALVEQVNQDHVSRLNDLKAGLEAVHTLMAAEDRRLEAVVPAYSPPLQAPQPQPNLHQASTHQPQVQSPKQPQQRIDDFLTRKLNERGAMSRGDLRRIAEQEGNFADAESAERGVDAALTRVVKAGLIRELTNGSFAPPTLLDTLRLRRAN